MLSGADDIAETQEKIRQIDECLKAGCFTLQKWTASDEQLLALIPVRKTREVIISATRRPPQLFRALGLLWQPRTDSFVFASRSYDEPPRISKRTVLSRVSLNSLILSDGSRLSSFAERSASRNSGQRSSAGTTSYLKNSNAAGELSTRICKTSLQSQCPDGSGLAHHRAPWSCTDSQTRLKLLSVQ